MALTGAERLAVDRGQRCRAADRFSMSTAIMLDHYPCLQGKRPARKKRSGEQDRDTQD